MIAPDPRNGGSHHTCTRDDEIERIVQRLDAHDGVHGMIAVELAEIRTTLGHAPDPVAGTQGTGAVGILYRIANTMATGAPRGALESLVGDDEGETTKIQSREDLIARAHEAEASRARVRLALIGAVVALISTLGTVATAWLATR